MTTTAGSEEGNGSSIANKTPSHDALSANDSDSRQPAFLESIPIPEIWLRSPRWVQVGGVAFLAILLASPWKILSTLGNLVWTIVGVSLGVGIGFGLAMHVYDQLQDWSSSGKKNRGATMDSSLADRDRHNANQSARDNKTAMSIHASNTAASNAATAATNSANAMLLLEDASSYFSLMALAGYPHHLNGKVLRGQVIRDSDPFWKVQYPFTSVRPQNQLGPQRLAQDFPSLPGPVTHALGRFLEHVMRDFIGMWYGILDQGCILKPEKTKRADGLPRDGGGQVTHIIRDRSGELKDVRPEEHNEKDNLGEDENKKDRTGEETSDESPHSSGAIDERDTPSKRMVFATLGHRRIPMLDQTYKLLSTAFGNLATRAEHVNVFSLGLLQFPKVLAHTFKVYRQLRKLAQEKNHTQNPTEIQITREFLLAGKLHKAVTFGLDVPSLLFADASGQDCGTGTGEASLNPTQVLEERLYGTNILKECELDYHRVVAHRLVRALMPKADSSSHVAVALVVEIFGNFVMRPMVDLFQPFMLNQWIVAATSGDKKNGSSTVQQEEEAKSATATPNHESNSLHTDSEAASTSNLQESSHVPSEGASSPETNSMPAQENSVGSEPVEQYKSRGRALLRSMAISLRDLQHYMGSFEACRIARLNNHEVDVDWADNECQMTARRLLFVVEASLLEGRCVYRSSGTEAAGTSSESFVQLLLDMTSDMTAFQRRIDGIEKLQAGLEGERSPTNPMNQTVDDCVVEHEEPESDHISSLRSLIAIWMHTGQLFKAISLVVRGIPNLFAPYYSGAAFLADTVSSSTFSSQLEVLHGVGVMVNATPILTGPRLEIETNNSSSLPSDCNVPPIPSKKPPGSVRSASGTPRQNAGNFEGWHVDDPHATSDFIAAFGTVSTPRYLYFHKNEAFAASLRSERERTMLSWKGHPSDETLHTVHRSNASEADLELHNELHNLSRTFYNGTNIMTIRDAARKSEGANNAGDQGKVSLLTVETVSNRRRIEVPDDDSSFLLRAQSRPLNPVSVHRDDRNHDLSYKCFLATYEESTLPNAEASHGGGRYIRRCFVHYYPRDRTTTVMLVNDSRKIDRRKAQHANQDAANHSKSVTCLSGAFLRERHLCQKWTSGISQSFLSSAVMEPSDFNAVPRSGKAIDFIYRMSLFESPAIDLAGKKFIVQDSLARGPHRADASALELRDATLSALLLTIGRDFEVRSVKINAEDDTDQPKNQNEYRHTVEMGPDGYPMIFMKFNKKQGDQVSSEIKPYRLSFVRAALLVTSAKQQAQFQCLSECVRAGSAKSATKARFEAHLKPVRKILEFANDRSATKVRSSKLLRDLKLGVYQVNREQLIRNGILNSRSPTTIVDLTAKVVGSVEAREVAVMIGSKLPATSILYKIQCTAIVELTGTDAELVDLEPYLLTDGTLARKYKEDWVVYRCMNDFQVLHKHLKAEVASSESSASTGSKLVGVATAAFTPGGHDRRQKKALMPSLAKASNIGTLSITTNVVEKRGELLDEYISYLLAPNHAMNRCTELLLFLGASYAFPPEVVVMGTPTNLLDPLGRLGFVRSVAVKTSNDDPMFLREAVPPRRKKLDQSGLKNSLHNSDHDASESDGRGSDFNESEYLLPSILNKVDQVPFSEVRNVFMELLRFQFGFENASFFRSRIIAALETASFVAMTKASVFRKTLYGLHSQHLCADSIGRVITAVLDVLWPDGCWLTPAPVLSEEELAELKKKSRDQLHAIFPEQIRKILGSDLTKDGLNLVHEMLQNRLVVKSLCFMLFDILWIEVFPELRDAMPCASALDMES